MGRATKTHVLVVDDDLCVRRMIAMALEDTDCEVVDTGDGAKALAVLRSSPIRWVVLLDWMMPGMSGQDLLRIVHAERSLATQHAFVLVTANAAALTPQFEALLRELCVPILSKPFNIQRLVSTVEAHARRIRVDEDRAEETA
jgi:CheY-like chemotaxis protein